MNQTPLILTVETSGRMGSIALATGPDLLAHASFSAPMRHSAEIFPAITTLLDRFKRKPEEIEHIYISVGPGSFTGLRIAVTLAKIMNLANSAKIVAVDTLDLVASNVCDFLASKEPKPPIERIAAVLDAKRGQFFIAVYDLNRNLPNNSAATFDFRNLTFSKILPDAILTAQQFQEQFPRPENPVWLLGEGLVYYKDSFKAPCVEFLSEDFWCPKAANLHLLGWQLAQNGKFHDPMTLSPNYLSRLDVKIKTVL